MAWYKKLHWQIALGILAGLIYALAVRTALPVPSGPDAAAVIESWKSLAAPFVFLGDLFIRALKMIIIPLVVVSVITGIQSLGDARELGKIGWRTVAYYAITTLVAVILGLLVVNLVQPGVGLGLEVDTGAKAPTPTPLGQVFSGIIPTSILGVFAGNKMLPSIFVAILFGVALLVIGEEGEPVRRLFESLNALILKVTDWIMATAPVGVAALFIKTLLDPKLADLAAFFQSLGSYSFAVVLGLLVHAAIFLPLLYLLFVRKSPRRFAQAMAPSLLTAFSTASSSATYPVTLECAVDAGVSRKSATFVLPLGATINMDGTALYEAVAAVFIANAIGMPLTFEQQIVVVVTATLAAIGAAGVPSAGLVTMIIVLESVGLPAEAYALVVAVDRILDMCRTTVNVWGDSIGAAVVSKWMEEAPEEAA